MLTQDQIEAYNRDGYVRVKGLFSATESAELAADMVRIIEEWGEQTIGWKGPWRDRYLQEEDRLNTKAVFLHRPDFYSAVWSRVIHHEKLVACVSDLIGDSVQWHHTVLHAKPPEMGTPFPMHQDYPFYPHNGGDFVDCLLHLDDAPLESGVLHVVPGSHKGGPIDHVLGPDTAPHLPPRRVSPGQAQVSCRPRPDRRCHLFQLPDHSLVRRKPHRSVAQGRTYRLPRHSHVSRGSRRRRPASHRLRQYSAAQRQRDRFGVSAQA